MVYPGIPHPDLGSVSDLHAFLAKLMQYQISAVSELDLAHFTRDSDWYNYDGSATSQSFGALFGASPVYTYRDATCSKPDFRTGAASQLVLSSILNRYVSTFGLRGFWLKGTLCLRLDGANCEQGVGSDNANAISFLRELANRGWTLFGEDGNGFVQAATSSIQDITAPILQGGLGFTAQSNLAKGELLVSIVLQKPVPGTELIQFMEGFATFSARHVLALNTPETIHVSTVSTIECRNAGDSCIALWLSISTRPSRSIAFSSSTPSSFSRLATSRSSWVSTFPRFEGRRRVLLHAAVLFDAVAVELQRGRLVQRGLDGLGIDRSALRRVQLHANAAFLPRLALCTRLDRVLRVVADGSVRAVALFQFERYGVRAVAEGHERTRGDCDEYRGNADQCFVCRAFWG